MTLRLDKKIDEETHDALNGGSNDPRLSNLNSPSILTRERFVWIAIAVILSFATFFHQFGRNSDDAWYSSTYMTLSQAHSFECIPTAASLAIHAHRNRAYWDNAVRVLAEQSSESTVGIKQSEDEYRLIVDTISNCTQPCNVLVFGVDWGSMLIYDANRLGRTVFLEDNYKWQQIVRRRVPCMESYLVHYSTRLRDWPLYENPANIKQLEMVLPLIVSSVPWDIIIVRGPSGESQRFGAWDSPGRMQSLYTASRLATWHFRYPPRRSFVDVIVFDAERLVEKRFSALFLGADQNVLDSAGSIKLLRLHDGFDLRLNMGLK